MIFVSSIDKTYKISPRLTAWNEFHTFCGNERSRRGSAGIGEANAEQGKRRRGSEATERVRPWWEEQRQAQRA